MEEQESDLDTFRPSVSVTQAHTWEPISVCKCLLPEPSDEPAVLSERKEKLYSRVAITENYLRERRIPELIRFFLSKVLANRNKNPLDYIWKLLDECMLFRAGVGRAPVVFEERHLQAVVKSFDPGQRGWLSAGQVRRAFSTLGLTPDEKINERTPTDLVLDNLRRVQEQELYNLLTTGGDGRASVEVSVVSF